MTFDSRLSFGEELSERVPNARWTKNHFKIPRRSRMRCPSPIVLPLGEVAVGRAYGWQVVRLHLPLITRTIQVQNRIDDLAKVEFPEATQVFVRKRQQRIEKQPSFFWMFFSSDACAPTTRRVLDLFEPVQCHELRTEGDSAWFFTEQTPLQRIIAALLGLNPRNYGRRLTLKIPRKRKPDLRKLRRKDRK